MALRLATVTCCRSDSHSCPKNVSTAGRLAQVVELAEGEAGGVKHASVAVSGQGVYGALKFESGVHRVQRVPATETAGRVHTSAASVAVLPQADAVRSWPLRPLNWPCMGQGTWQVS